MVSYDEDFPLQNNNGEIFQAHVEYLGPPFPMLLYLRSGPVRLLLANAIGHRLVLSGTMSFWHAVPLCTSVIVLHPGPILEASVSKQSGLVSS